jgi:hypothetical protein
MSLAFIDRKPSTQEIQKLRLILSIFQDGTGQLATKDNKTLPGWRDFERAVALTFGGIAQESKAVFDVLIPDPNKPGINYGLSCKMRGLLTDLDRTGRATIELSNSAGKFWQALNAAGLRQDNYRLDADSVGRTLLDLVRSWHEAVSIFNHGNVDLRKSYYLVLSWNKQLGDYQLHQFPLQLLDHGLKWCFPAEEAHLRGDDETGKLYEWYGESGGQLKYYPPVSAAIWTSDRFKLEPLPTGNVLNGLVAKAMTYFPRLWSEINHIE